VDLHGRPSVARSGCGNRIVVSASVDELEAVMNPLKIHLIAAARPNFMKIRPPYHALSATLVPRHDRASGQHYDSTLRLVLPRFEAAGTRFSSGSGQRSHAEQTGRVMKSYEKIASPAGPTGSSWRADVNSTLACALVGAKLCIPVVHLEAGLRSGDRRCPRKSTLATDGDRHVLWTPSADADANLLPRMCRARSTGRQLS